jgi:hypothetical protein
MMKHFVYTALLLLGSTALRAGEFDFSFSGTGGVSASGELTTTGSGGEYTITGITGTQNGAALSDGGGGLTFLGSNLLIATITFDLPGNSGELVSYIPGLEALEFGSVFSVLSDVSITPVGSVSGVPEPATLLLLLTMGLGVWVFARRLPSKNTTSR